MDDVRRTRTATRTLLRELRIGANLRQEELAARLGKPQSFVSKLETGERRADLAEVRQICSAMSVGLADFVERLERSLDQPSSGVGPDSGDPPSM
jgi:transcriptional regulator with XRE-family HTH domain